MSTASAAARSAIAVAAWGTVVLAIVVGLVSGIMPAFEGDGYALTFGRRRAAPHLGPLLPKDGLAR